MGWLIMRMKFIFLLFGITMTSLVVCGFGVSATAMAGVKVIKSVAYYDVSGNSATQLLHQMDARCPGNLAKKGTEKSAALTCYRLRWVFTNTRADGKCRAGEVSVTLKLAYVYPRWVNKAAAPVKLRLRWERLLTHLVDHEQQHGRIALDAAKDVFKGIKELRPHQTCKAFNFFADALADGIHRRIKALQQEFDRKQETFRW